MNIQAKLDALTAVSKTLNDTTDQFGKCMAGIENHLNNIRVGVTAWVECFRDDDGSRYELGYTRVAGHWGLAIRTVDLKQTDEWTFSSAPRRLRVMTIDHIPELLDALIEEAKWHISLIRERKWLVEEMAAAMRTGYEEDHVDCPCWATGSYKRVEGCKHHPYDL